MSGRTVEEPTEEHAGNLVALPGERLSRAVEVDSDIDGEEDDEAALAAGSANGHEPLGEEGRRRRRRRGGRGRGRGRRPRTRRRRQQRDSAFDEDEEYEELPTAQPPVHAFGSVWDSQLGVPTGASMPPAVDLGGGDAVEEDDYDEPEVPEYLLAERRQRGQRTGGGRGCRTGGGRNRSAYQAALDRERYGGSDRPAELF